MTKIKILIVEDEVLIAIQLKMQLTRAGFEVLGPVATGQEAITHARDNDLDVVLMDIRLSGKMDGIDAAKEIRAFSSAGIIFTTGYQDANQKNRAMELNPCAYLIKPVKASTLQNIIETAIKS